jgi:transposase
VEGVERFFAWLGRYRRLNTVFERSNGHLIAFVAIAFISILSRRFKRLVVEERSA